ncbi:MAG: putative glycoside hydrolase family 15 protein [Ignavibacteria bacterium]|nr:putative glycoside hydrolase family 15 protein [Ignavibacteria bacterium]
MFSILIILFLLSSVNLTSQSIDYAPRGCKSYLVNYYAIRNNHFLTKLAYKRFAFLDEASRQEISLLRKLDKNYLILFYKDVVALNTYLPEFPKMNLEEDAFLHCSEPSSLTVTFDKRWKLYWMADRRFDTTANIAYRVYWSFDSTSNFSPVDTIVKSTELEISLPKSARWAMVKTIYNDTTELSYGFPVKLEYKDSIPVYVPVRLYSSFIERSNSTLSYFIFKLVTPYIPDSVYLFADYNKNNNFDSSETKIFKTNLDTIQIFLIDTENLVRAGIELYLLCYKDGKVYRYPKSGFWTTNPNNRIRNETYSFFVMDVGSEKWRKNYISQVLSAFTRGYNGLFADDTWERIGLWGVDVFPPLNYSDSAWIENVAILLRDVKREIGNRIFYFNGLWGEPSLRFLEHTDGGMLEGFAHSTWGSYATESYWKLSCNLGIKCQNLYKKDWLALSGLRNKSREPRLFSFASFLLVAGEKSYFGNAENYQTFAHFPEFDIPVGNPLKTPKNSIEELRSFDNIERPYYVREFENCTVYVNPSEKNNVLLPHLSGLPEVSVDTLLTIEGGRVFTIISDSVLKPRSAKIILKGQANSTKLTSPFLRNPRVHIYGNNPRGLLVKISVECADSSSNHFKSNPNLPLYVYADLTGLGKLEDVVLANDGTPASDKFVEYSAEIYVPEGATLKNVRIPIVALSTTGLMAVAYAKPELVNVDTLNLVQNFSFEFDVDLDGIPDFWTPAYNRFIYDTSGINAQHFSRSVKVENPRITDSGGVFTAISINQSVAKPLVVSGWSKAENVSGSKDDNYSVYVDFFFTDGQPWYGKTTRFSTGTHDWEFSSTVYYPPKPVRNGRVYCLFRAHSGTVWFDNIFVGEFDTTTTFVSEKKGIKINVPSVISSNRQDFISIYSQENLTLYFRIFDIYGRKFKEFTIPINPDMNVIPFWLLCSTLANGPYLLQVQFENEILVFPFLVNW